MQSRHGRGSIATTVRAASVLLLGTWSGCREPASPGPADPPATESSASTADATEADGPLSGTVAAEDTTEGGVASAWGLAFVELAVDGGLSLTTDFRFIPQTMEFLALSKSGRVGHYIVVGDDVRALGEFTLPGVYSDRDCGLISLAFDPDYVDNGFAYLGTCISQTHSAIYRVTFTPGDYAAIASTATEIIVVGDAAAPKPWHNIGQIGFDGGGNLWALFGDKHVRANGQDVANDLSALVRIVPNREVGGAGHQPASGNPFAQTPGASPNIVALGLRSPWTGVYDSQGRWWIGDVGANGVEEINIVGAPGRNFGWPLYEGPCEGACEGLTDPVAWWAHEGTHPYELGDPDASTTNARVGWVGLEYTARYTDRYDGELRGTVLFGDYCVGFVRGLEVNNAGVVTSDRPLGHLRLPSAWAEGIDGFIYVSTFGRCETPGLDRSDPPPSRFLRVVPR